MSLVSINDEYLTDIGNALRSKVGETKKELQEIEFSAKISKTPNATSFSTFTGGYPNDSKSFDTITITGAARLEVRMAYQTENTSYDWVQVMAGKVTSASGTKYGGKTLSEVNLTFNSDSVTFYFKSDSSVNNYLGYYAEVIGYDANGNQITTEIAEVDVPNKFKPREMASTISSIQTGGKPVATGTFRIPLAIQGDTLTITSVTGLGFQPTSVIVFRKSSYTSGDSVENFTAKSGAMQVSAVYNTPEFVGSHFFLQTSSSSKAYLYFEHDGRTAYIEFDEDGFTLKSDGTTNGNEPYFDRTYAYIAIG